MVCSGLVEGSTTIGIMKFFPTTFSRFLYDFWPLQKIILPILDEKFIDQIEKVKDLILHEVNVKEIEYITDTSGIIHKGIKPNFKTLGSRLGKNMKEAAAIIHAFTQKEIAIIEKTGKYSLEIADEKFELILEDFVITAEDIPGWLVAVENEMTVALDINLDDSLISEGLARELVNRIQNLRKSNDFNVTDRIIVEIEKNDHIRDAIASFGEYIKSETLADEIIVLEKIDIEETELTESTFCKLQIIKS